MTYARCHRPPEWSHSTYEPASFKRAKVHLDYHIDIDAHYCSVPHSLVGKTVEARITDSVIEVLRAGQRAARHPRSASQGRHTTISAHMPASHRAHLEWTPERFRRWAGDIGPSTLELVDYLLTLPNWTVQFSVPLNIRLFRELDCPVPSSSSSSQFCPVPVPNQNSLCF